MVQVGVLIGETTFQGVSTGSSGLSRQSHRFLRNGSQASKPAALALRLASSIPTYLGWNCLM